MTTWKAVVLGVVEGVTEYLPVSSTGHLLVTQRILGIGDTDATKDAADTYAIAIQFGAILAVLVLYWQRIVSILKGLIGQDSDGRRLLIALVMAFLPAVVGGRGGRELDQGPPVRAVAGDRRLVRRRRGRSSGWPRRSRPTGRASRSPRCRGSRG